MGAPFPVVFVVHLVSGVLLVSGFFQFLFVFLSLFLILCDGLFRVSGCWIWLFNGLGCLGIGLGGLRWTDVLGEI